MARIVRGQCFSLKSQQFVAGGAQPGASQAKSSCFHPSAEHHWIIVVTFTLTIPAVIIDESFLSFLASAAGAAGERGLSLPTGRRINPIRSYWWHAGLPGGDRLRERSSRLNVHRDALRDVLDPRSAAERNFLLGNPRCPPNNAPPMDLLD